jgi:glucose/mannose-6-phosphate isomerase
MLDDLKYIHQKDVQDVLGIAERQWQQLTQEFELSELEGEFQNIVFAAMGGSALPALVSTSWPAHKVPFAICRQYHIPAYVSDKTLFIAASYSGNTEETLSALAEAEERGARIVIMASGGKLQEIAQAKSYPFLLIPAADQPRYAVFYMLKALITVLEKANLINVEEAGKELAQAAGFLKQSVQAWVPTVPTDQNPAKKLALDLAGRSPIIYAGPLLGPVAYKWKINCNENAKNVAWWNEVPEFDHNELIGWTSHPVDKPYAVIELRSKLEHPRVQKRFEVAERLLSGQRPAANIVEVQGETLVEQIVWGVAFGDFVTTYLALLNGVNPAPVGLVEKFKKALDE